LEQLANQAFYWAFKLDQGVTYADLDEKPTPALLAAVDAFYMGRNRAENDERREAEAQRAGQFWAIQRQARGEKAEGPASLPQPSSMAAWLKTQDAGASVSSYEEDGDGEDAEDEQLDDAEG
jgi:hypothetical protein